MTTAQTPSDAERLARGLEEGFCGHAAWLQPAAAELRRLQAENERLRGQVGRFQGIPLPLIEAINAATGSNEWQGERSPAELLGPACRAITALVERKNACIHKLEMDALDLASENSILKRAETDELEARKPLPLSDEQIDAIADGMPGGLGGFLKTWGWRQFARKILDLRAPPTWEPGFDCMVPGQEELVMQFCLEIAGPRGQPGRNPDPVRLLEMAEALYKAEADARLVDKSPNLQEPLVDKTANLQDRPTSLIASREVVSDGPLRVTRLHLIEEGRASLTSTATGPLPGIKET
ncbi:hypothetical protein N5K37_31715 [Delftia tsuruhatensis]|uniref:hypothetical protein n=1 Tax=Delftia tsuruhatensis TaxID=180282 RepID=UPI002449400E|nr:hypothetical protein [Delftia tsuruhatensis]MDH2234488.1 hypothetical protein [Delftia tsuruhatensis]